MASQITSLTIVYLTAYSGADQRKHQSSASLAFVRGIHRGPVNSQHKWPVTQKMFPFYDVIMTYPAKEVICSWGAGVFARTLPHQVRCCSSPISSVQLMTKATINDKSLCFWGTRQPRKSGWSIVNISRSVHARCFACKKKMFCILP